MKLILVVSLLSMVSLLPSLLWSQTALLSSRKAPANFDLTADPIAAEWRSIDGIVMESDYFGSRVPNHRTEVRSHWTRSHLYLLYVCQYEELNLKPDPVTTAETHRLWNWDVAESFLGMRVKARIDAAAKIWCGEMEIPFEAISEGPLAAGRELRAGFFRIAGIDPAKKKVSWQATGRSTFHVPEKFGILRLVE